jgi:beta-glucosidase
MQIPCRKPKQTWREMPYPQLPRIEQNCGMSFPSNFSWGAAASAYQIEGATRADGRGLCVWDMFCRKDGAIFSGHSGDVACGHYHRFRDDVRIMRQMHLQAYRLSISWPRVLPDGTGTVNEKGLAFYDQLIDALLEAGITPWVTLFHWDYPYALYCRGGWLNAKSPEWFAEYAGVVARRLGDRVKHWITLNEPQCFIGLGHREGIQAPGLKLAWMDVLRAMHHALIAHGRAVQALREHCKVNPLIGWSPLASCSYPATSEACDIEAARRRSFSVDSPTFWPSTLFSDPVCLGHYPDDALRTFGDDFPRFTLAEMETIRQSIDFYGMNIYQGQRIRAGDDGRPVAIDREPGHAINAYHWPIEPPVLYWGPRFIYERYKTPIFITENGLSCMDWVATDGQVHDPQRIDFTRRYLCELERAIGDGVDVRGYFHWSLMDNFEWADGYRQRFGLVHVDYRTQRRTLKDSAKWYATVIRSNGREIHADSRIPSPELTHLLRAATKTAASSSL